MLFSRLHRLVPIASLLFATVAPAQDFATGTVFEDRNGNGVREAGERGLRGVRVSNQREVVLTDRDGRWRLPLLASGETTFFVVKPRGYMTPLSPDRLPRFSYTHKPAGSPVLKHRGLAPTGPLPASVDFALSKQAEPDTFQAIFFGDTQPRDRLSHGGTHLVLARGLRQEPAAERNLEVEGRHLVSGYRAQAHVLVARLAQLLLVGHNHV